MLLHIFKVQKKQYVSDNETVSRSTRFNFTEYLTIIRLILKYTYVIKLKPINFFYIFKVVNNSAILVPSSQIGLIKVIISEPSKFDTLYL